MDELLKAWIDKRGSVRNEKEDFIFSVVAASKINKTKARVLANELWNLGKESNKLATNECNRELTKDEDKRALDLDFKVKEIGEKLGLRTYRQRDPRYNTIKVVVGRELSDNDDWETCGCG